jgi:hypothetical protein
LNLWGGIAKVYLFHLPRSRNLDSKYIFEMEPIGFSDETRMRHKENRRAKDDANVFGPINA